MSDAFPWAIAIVGGPILLFVALVWAKTRTSRRNRRIDPVTPSDDPAQGM